MSEKLAVSLEQLCALLSVGICRRVGGIHLSAGWEYLAWQEPSSHKVKLKSHFFLEWGREDKGK